VPVTQLATYGVQLKSEYSSRQSNFVEWLTLAGFCAYFFYFGLSTFGLVGADEPRYAQVAREMLTRHDWITPTLYGHAWLEKPILYYWEAIIAYKVFGVSDWAARLPSAISATAMIVAVYGFFRRFRPGTQLDAALITASAAAIIGFAHGASTDMPLSAMLTIALLAWLAWSDTGLQTWLAGFYAFLALAVLAKGPVAVFLAAAIIVVLSLVKREWLLLWRTLWLPGILLFCVVALPWYVAVQLRNPQFFHVFILEHNLARFATGLYRHEQPFWYYLPVIGLSLLPWTVLALAAVVSTIRSHWTLRPRNSAGDFNLFFLIWALVPVVFFSFSQSKLPGYILPAVPAFTLLATGYLRQAVPDNVMKGTASYAWGHVVWIICHCSVAAGMIVPLLLSQYLLLHVPVARTALIVASGVTGAVFIAMIATIFVSGVRTLRFVTLVPAVLGVAILLRIGGPQIESTLSAMPIASQLNALDSKHLPVAVFHATRETEYGLAFYLNRTIESYERGEMPAAEHLLVASETSEQQLSHMMPGRRVAHLGSYSPQHLEYFWVGGAGSKGAMHE